MIPIQNDTYSENPMHWMIFFITADFVKKHKMAIPAMVRMVIPSIVFMVSATVSNIRYSPFSF